MDVSNECVFILEPVAATPFTWLSLTISKPLVWGRPFLMVSPSAKCPVILSRELFWDWHFLDLLVEDCLEVGCTVLSWALFWLVYSKNGGWRRDTCSQRTARLAGPLGCGLFLSIISFPGYCPFSHRISYIHCLIRTAWPMMGARVYVWSFV